MASAVCILAVNVVALPNLLLFDWAQSRVVLSSVGNLKVLVLTLITLVFLSILAPLNSPFVMLWNFTVVLGSCLFFPAVELAAVPWLGPLMAMPPIFVLWGLACGRFYLSGYYAFTDFATDATISVGPQTFSSLAYVANLGIVNLFFIMGKYMAALNKRHAYPFRVLRERELFLLSYPARRVDNVLESKSFYPLLIGSFFLYLTVSIVLFLQTIEAP